MSKEKDKSFYKSVYTIFWQGKVSETISWQNKVLEREKKNVCIEILFNKLIMLNK